MSVGIIGLGAFLPDDVRTNDWWPAEIVQGWRTKPDDMNPSSLPDPETLPPGARLTLEAMAEEMADPFRGAMERRIISESMSSSDMEVLACREAMKDASVEPQEIDFLLGFSFCPDFLNSPNACAVHEQLGLRRDCMATGIDSVCGSFITQLTLAEQLIRTGTFRRGLLFQSSSVSRVLPWSEPFSAWFGDGATAVVVGEVPAGRGIVGRSHRTDGAYHRGLLCGIKGKRWHDDGPVVAYLEDRKVAGRMILEVAENGKEALHEAISQARWNSLDVDFIATHQATRWFRRVVQETAGMQRARSVDTFTWAGSLSACNIPLVLTTAKNRGLLREGDRVAMYAGGTGVTWGSIALTWGK